jgi:hypothetical protein
MVDGKAATVIRHEPLTIAISHKPSAMVSEALDGERQG